ncbi:MAG: DNA-processing protein DprA [Oscillospiraceae bacterium]|nr:DNA-processing protein DprA [Oscillospiraceae bacterium]
MNSREQGFLLLTGQLGDPGRKPLTVAQFRDLTARVRTMEKPKEDRRICAGDLTALGYSAAQADRILTLLSQRERLEYYLYRAAQQDCRPITRVSEGYPLRVRQALGEDSPGCLWVKGEISLLGQPCVSLVGSRELRRENRSFACLAGQQAARQGYVLVSGNARGADKAAQQACLEAGGSVICIVADSLESHGGQERVLYISEDGFDLPFSAQRAHSRNRLIHSISPLVLVAQTDHGTGGTWKGTQRNLQRGWSRVCCFDDGSAGAQALMGQGALAVSEKALDSLLRLIQMPNTLFDL